MMPFEEAVANAVYHRGFSVREPVEIRIMHDKLVMPVTTDQKLTRMPE